MFGVGLSWNDQEKRTIRQCLENIRYIGLQLRGFRSMYIVTQE